MSMARVHTGSIKWLGMFGNGCRIGTAANYYEVSPEYNSQGPEQGQFKVLRGGSWSDLPKYLLTYGRFKLPPETRNSYTGLRCAKS